jgi:hypothetical protein
VVIVNEAFIKRYFGGRNPLGARVAMGSGPDAKPDTEIIGVVENISYRGVREQWEQAYFPIGTELSGSNFYVRFRGTLESAFRSIRAILRNANPTLPITYFRTLDDQVNRSLNTERMLAALSSSFSTLALLLSLVGLYAVMSFVVTQRTRRDRYSIGDGGDTPFYRLASARRCAGDGRRGNSDRAAMRLGVGPSC